MLRCFFTAVYFGAFLYVIDLIFRHTVSPVTDILAVICWAAAFIASVILADYTIKKIEEKYSKK